MSGTDDKKEFSGPVESEKPRFTRRSFGSRAKTVLLGGAFALGLAKADRAAACGGIICDQSDYYRWVANPALPNGHYCQLVRTNYWRSTTNPNNCGYCTTTSLYTVPDASCY